MPYFKDPNLDKDDEQSGEVQLSSGMQAGQGGSFAPAQQPNKAQNTGSHFTNLNAYLNNNDAQGFGQQFGQKLQSGVDQAKGTIDSAASTVKNQINQSYQAPTADQINSAVSSAGKNTTADDAKQYQQWLSAQYTAPRSLADSQAASSQVTGAVGKAQAEANAATTEPGRFALLDQYFGRPNYNFGQKSLDNALIQGGGGFSNAKQIQDQATQLGGYANTQAQDIARMASQKEGDISTSRDQARSALDSATSGFQSDLDSRTSAANDARAKAIAGYKEQLSHPGNVDAATKGIVGLANGAHVYDLDLSNYLTGGNQITRQQAASDQDYARSLALSQLAGQDPTYLTADTRNQAGQIGSDATYDSAALMRDIENRGHSANDAYRQAFRQVIGPEYGNWAGDMSISDLKRSASSSQDPEINKQLQAALTPYQLDRIFGSSFGDPVSGSINNPIEPNIRLTPNDAAQDPAPAVGSLPTAYTPSVRPSEPEAPHVSSDPQIATIMKNIESAMRGRVR